MPSEISLAWGSKLKKPEYRTKLISLAHNLGTNPDYLATVIAVETNGKLDPGFEDPKNGTVGLICFTHKTATDLGTTKEKLKRMNFEDQLDYVQKYFNWWRGKNLATLEDLYMAVFCPKAIGKSPDYVCYEKGKEGYSG